MFFYMRRVGSAKVEQALVYVPSEGTSLPSRARAHAFRRITRGSPAPSFVFVPVIINATGVEQASVGKGN